MTLCLYVMVVYPGGVSLAWCVMVVCPGGVSWWCVLVVCPGGVSLAWCVMVVCPGGVSCRCVSCVVCHGGVSWRCVLVVCLVRGVLHLARVRCNLKTFPIVGKMNPKKISDIFLFRFELI